MTLKDEFEARYSAAWRAQISNPDTENSESAQNDALVNLACEDVEADFATEVGLTLDLDERRHVTVAVRMVELWLMEYGGSGGSAMEKRRDYLSKKIEMLRQTSARARVEIKTTSTIRHSTRDAAHPPFDDEHFEDHTPLPPNDSTP